MGRLSFLPREAEIYIEARIGPRVLKHRTQDLHYKSSFPMDDGLYLLNGLPYSEKDLKINAL